MARLPVPWPLGRRGSWLQSSCLLTTHLRSPEGVGQKTHAQSHLKQQSPNVHGAEGSVFQQTPPHPAILIQSRGGRQGPDLENLQGLAAGPTDCSPSTSRTPARGPDRATWTSEMAGLSVHVSASCHGDPHLLAKRLWESALQGWMPAGQQV